MPSKIIKKLNIFNNIGEKNDERYEKFRNLTAFKTIDFFYGASNYFDFFSKDLHDAAISSKKYAQNLQKKKVSISAILFSVFNSSQKLSNLLLPYYEGVNTEEGFRSFLLGAKKSDSSLKLSKLNNWIKPKVFFSTRFSLEVSEAFFKSLKNAFFRFKTAVITPEIFFFTLLEGPWKISKKIRKAFKVNGSYTLIRSRLIKQIHEDNLDFFSAKNKSELYFGYLLKKELSSALISKIIKAGLLNEAISIFQKALIERVSNLSIFSEIKKDFLLSINFSYSQRKYHFANLSSPK